MKLEEAAGYAEAVRAMNANRSPRFEALNELERWVATTQYDDRKADWLDECDVPLWERRPSVAYPIVATAIASNVDLVLGEGRFPEIRPADDVDAEDDRGDETKKAVGTTLSDLVERCRVKAVCREVLAGAQGCSSGVAIAGIRRGKLFADTTKAKWCEPEFDVDGNVTRLEIRYPYLDRVWDAEFRRWRVEAKVYRRVIDDARDVTFLPAKADPDGLEPKWTEDPKRTFRHGFSFCPVVWYAHRKGTTVVNDIDGTAVHDRLLDEIKAHDYALSQRHRCALKLEPQIVEIGVPAGYSPTEPGRAPVQRAHPGDAIDMSRDLSKLQYNQSYDHPSDNLGAARKKGPGFPWQYPSDKSRVEMLQLNPGALEALNDHIADLRTRLSESMAVVFLDPDNLKFAATVSGKALSIMKQRQLDACDITRDDFGDGFIVPLVKMLLRIALKSGAKLKGLDKSRAAIARMLDEDASLKLDWGDYFAPGTDEEKALVEMVRAAYEGGLVTLRMAVEKLQRPFGIESVDAALEEIEAAAEEKQRKEQEALHTLQQELNAEGGAEPGSGAGGGAKPPKAARGGSGRTPALEGQAARGAAG
jgi:hypothetical protein